MLQGNNENIVAPVRSFNARVRAYTSSSLAYDFCETDELQALTITRAAEQNKFFGFGICQKANVKLRDVDRATNISTDHTLNITINDTEFLPYFKVTEVHRNENTNQLSITAYDKLYWAAGHTVGELTTLPISYTIKQFTEKVIELLTIDGLVIDTAAEGVFNTFYTGGGNFEGIETLRAALDAVAEATQTIYFINKEQKLCFVRPRTDSPSLIISKDDYFTLDSKTNRRLTKIYSVTELGDDVFAEIEGVWGSTQYVRDNPFWDIREDVGTLVDNALAAVGGLTLNQFEVSWRGNYLVELCDCIGLVTKDNDIAYSIVVNDTIEYDGGYRHKTQWLCDDEDLETASNPTSLGETLKKTYARVDKINREITLVASESNEVKKQMAEVLVKTNSITQTVTNLETKMEGLDGIEEELITLREEVETKITAEDATLLIKKELGEGVDKVTTSTGFTFNDEGLTVSKSNSEMSTTITEDGMKVYRNNEEVLTVDNEGVKAEDLHATTYLIIGRNSRFEDYTDNNGNERTGCFWIGN